MTTMDEKFEAFLLTLTGFKTERQLAEIHDAYLAGADANQQLVIEAITDLMRTDAELAVTVDGYNESLTELRDMLLAARTKEEHNG